jgi:FtsZ-binding cell division protein ZapB
MKAKVKLESASIKEIITRTGKLDNIPLTLQYDIIHTIEALQQEVKGWESRYDELGTGHSKLFKDFCELQQENERLKEKSRNYMDAYDTARNIIGEQRKEIYNLEFGIRLRELKQENEHLQAQMVQAARGSAGIVDLAAENEQLQAQAAQMQKALKHARETLITLNTLGGLGFDKHRWIDEALAAIDKIGGQEDV